MKKNLLLLLTFLAWLGVSESFGQVPKPTVAFELLNNRHCVSGQARISLTLTGSGVFDVIYNIKSDTEDTNRKEHINAYTLEAPYDASSSTTITILAIYDENYPEGGGISGDIIGSPSATITIDQMPTVAISDQVKTCRRSITLDASPGTEYTEAYWELTAGGTFDDKNLPNATYTADTDGNYALTYTVKNGTCTKSLAKTFPIAYVAPPNAIISVADQTLCEGHTTSLDLSGVTGRQSMVLNYSDGANNIAHPFNATSVSIPLNPTTNTTYKMNSLVDVEGCSQPLSDEFTVQVDKTPVAVPGSEINECDTLITLNAQLQNTTLFSGEWSLSPGLSFVDNDNTIPNAKVWIPKKGQLAEQAYTLNWSIWNKNNLECKDDANVDINFYKQPENVSAGNDTTIHLEDKMALLATGYENGMNGQWRVLSDDTEKPIVEDVYHYDTQVTNLRMGNNQIEWLVSNTDLCPIKGDTINIKVSGIKDPTGFSPNGDGINDFFVIGGAKQVNNNKLVVFDITGKTIFTTSNFCNKNGDTTNGWDGNRSDGSQIDDGTYYYIFTGDDIEPVKNYVIIKRGQ